MKKDKQGHCYRAESHLHSNWKTKGLDTDPVRRMWNTTRDVTGQMVGTRWSAHRVGFLFFFFVKCLFFPFFF